MELNYKMALFAALLYFMVLAVAFTYKVTIIIPTENLASNNTVIHNLNVSNSSIITTTTQVQNSNGGSNTLLIYVVELVVITLAFVAEMKLGIFSLLITKLSTLAKEVKIMTIVFIGVVTGFVLTSYFGLIGLTFAFILIIGFYIISKAIVHPVRVFTVMICVAYAAVIINPLFLLALPQIYGTALELIVIGVLAIGGYKLGQMLEENYTKNMINFVAALSIFPFCLIIGLGLSPLIAVAALILFSIYDLIAVFYTKHMQVMAKGMIEQKMPALFIFGDSTKLSDRLKGKKRKTKKIDVAALGTGDILIPGVLIVSTAVYAPNLAIFVTVGASIGMVFNTYVLSTGKFKQGIPALPLITIGQIFFIGISLIISFIL